MISVDYLIGAVLGILTLMFINSKSTQVLKKRDFIIENSQSHLFEIVKPILPDFIKEDVRKDTQSYRHEKKTNVKVIIMDGSAFWIKDNVFYTANFDENGINKETTSVVDIMGMNKVQLNKMLFIMDQLRDGEVNDSWGTGN